MCKCHEFDAKAHWERPGITPKWKVYVEILLPRRKKPVTETKYVQAKTKAGAARTAIFWTFTKGKIISAQAEYATPRDLGAYCEECQPTL